MMRHQRPYLAVLSRPTRILLLLSITITVIFVNAGYLYRLYPETFSAARPEGNSDKQVTFRNLDSEAPRHCELNNNLGHPSAHSKIRVLDRTIPSQYHAFGNKVILDELDQSKRGEQVELLLAVLTCDSEKEESFRNAVRDTWSPNSDSKKWHESIDDNTTLPIGSQNRNTFNSNAILRLFFIGTQNMTSERLRYLKQEQLLHRDIIFLPNHQDTYANLTSKMAQIHHFLMRVQPAYFPNLKWLFKTDTDVFISLPTLYNLTYQYEPRKIILGHKLVNTPVLRSGKWKSDYSSNWYPVYVAGAGYLMSFDVSRWIGENYENGWLNMLSNEDAALGIWVAGLVITLLHSDDVITGTGSNALFTSAEDLCERKKVLLDRGSVFLIHHLTLEGLRSVGEKVKKDGKYC